MNKDTIRDTAILTSVGLSVATTAYVAVSALFNNTPPLQPNQPLPILVTGKSWGSGGRGGAGGASLPTIPPAPRAVSRNAVEVNSSLQAPSFQDASFGRGIKPHPKPLPQLPLPPQLPQLSSLDQ